MRESKLAVRALGALAVLGGVAELDRRAGALEQGLGDEQAEPQPTARFGSLPG